MKHLPLACILLISAAALALLLRSGGAADAPPGRLASTADPGVDGTPVARRATGAPSGRLLAPLFEPDPPRPRMSAAQAGMLSGLAADGAPVVDRRDLTLLRQLVIQHPHREELNGMLLTGLDEQEPLALDLCLLTGAEDPRLVKSHLIGAFEKADRAQALRLMKRVEDLFAAGSRDLRLELARAVAAAAPVELATTFLAERAGPIMLGLFDTVGLRPGGQEALARGYDELAAAGAGATARRMIVSGLAKSGSAALLGIAHTDPDPAVRGQAALTATWAPDFAPTSEFLGELRRLASLGERGPPTYAVLSSASNLLARAELAGDPVLAAETVGFLRELALDPEVSADDRARVPGLLEPHLSPDEHHQLARAVAELGSE